MSVTSRKFARGLIFCGIMLSFGCSGSERETGQVRPGCYSVGLGIDVPFCLIGFNEALYRASLNESVYYQVRAVLSKEFDDCVLHRDLFAAENYLDSESILIDDQFCADATKNLLGDRGHVLVDVRGRLVSFQQRGFHRAGKFVEIVRLENAHELKRK